MALQTTGRLYCSNATSVSSALNFKAFKFDRSFKFAQKLNQIISKPLNSIGIAFFASVFKTIQSVKTSRSLAIVVHGGVLSWPIDKRIHLRLGSKLVWIPDNFNNNRTSH